MFVTAGAGAIVSGYVFCRINADVCVHYTILFHYRSIGKRHAWQITPVAVFVGLEHLSRKT